MPASQSAVQLYTLREFLKTRADFIATLDKVRAIGYTAVQFSAVGCMNGEKPEVDAATARKLLDERGLACVATHRGWDALAKDTQREIDFHQALGCKYAGIGGIPAPYREQGAAGFRQFARDAQPTLAKLKAAGIVFVYHNHAFEFKRILPGRKTWYDAFIEEGGADFGLEIDTYWAAHAGVNPTTLIRRCAGRVPVIHVKDKDVTGNDGVFAPIGEGNLAWDEILPACRAARVEWYCVEQDNCYGRDPFDCLKSSFEFLVSKGV